MTHQVSRERMEDLEAKVLADHETFKGKVILAKVVSGYRGEDSVEVYVDPPVRCRVEPMAKNDICHWNDEWLDPYWDIEVLEDRPELRGLRSTWTFGRSYNGETGEGEAVCTEWTAEQP